jgi:PAS domain-containing protein
MQSIFGGFIPKKLFAMRILLAAPGPKLVKIITQLAQELAPQHTIAVYDPLLLREFPAFGISTYAAAPLIAAGRSKLNSLVRQLSRKPREEISYLGLPLWPATDFEQKQAYLVGRRLKPDWFIRHGLEIVAAADAILADFHPEVAAVWNGNTLESRAFAHLARTHGAAVFYLERGLLPDSLVIDPRGVNAESYLCTEVWQEIAATPPEEASLSATRRYLEEVIRAGRSIVNQPEAMSPAEVRAGLGLPPQAKFILVPAQIDWDTNIIYHSPLFKTNTEVLEAIKAALTGREDCFIVFKPHPEEPKQIDFQALLGERGRVTTEINLHSLLAAADLVVVRNSTVGLEAVAHRKPTAVLGRAIYSHKGFTYDLSARGELSALLGRALQEGFSLDQEEKAERFFTHLISDYHYFLGKPPIPGVNVRRRQMLIEAGCAAQSHYPEEALLLSELSQVQTQLAERWRQEIRAGETFEQLRALLASLPASSPVLIVQAADAKPFRNALEIIASWNLSLDYRIIALNSEAESLMGFGKVISQPRAALLELVRARLGKYRIVIFACTNYAHPSAKVVWSRLFLQPIKTHFLDCTLGVDLYRRQ